MEHTTHKLTREVGNGYTAEILLHETADGRKGDFVRLGNQAGQSIWIGTTDGENFERLPQDLETHLEAEYKKLPSLYETQKDAAV